MFGLDAEGWTPIVPRKPVIIILTEHEHRFAYLIQIVQAFDAQSFLLGLCQGGQKQAGENTDDGNHHEHLDECECTAGGGF